MKIIKKLLFVCVTALLCFCITKPVFDANQQSAKAETLQTNVFNLVTLTQNGQNLNYDNLQTVENDTFIIVNDTLTITTKPFETAIMISNTNEMSYYHELTYQVTIESDDPEKRTYVQDWFNYGEDTHYFRNHGDYLALYRSSPPLTGGTAPFVTTRQTNLIRYEVDPSTYAITITVVEGYTLKESAPSNTFTFTNSRDTNNRTNTYNLNFEKTVVNFANNQNPIVSFDTFETDGSGNPFPPSETIQSEQTFEKMKIEFLNNNYTETNPLFFDINFNGFVYTFKLFEKENLLYVNYIDENNPELNNRYLATHLVSDGEGNLVIDGSGISKSKLCSLTFTKTGRYAFEIYDYTYLLGLSNANYYDFSFYIKNPTQTEFENIYTVIQSLDEDGNEIEYIANKSILNYSAKITIKNLSDIANLSDVIEKITVSAVGFGQENTIIEKTDYSTDFITNNFDENGDFNIVLTADRYYEIDIYPVDTSLYSKKTVLTIVKMPKTSFNIKGTNEEPHEPFKTYTVNDSIIINSDYPLELYADFTGSEPSITPQTLLKTYVNNYVVTLGQLKISIQKVSIVAKDEKEDTSGLHIEIKGVGDMVVTVTYNGKETVYHCNSEEKINSVLTFKGYGKYHVHVVDSMGYEASQSFSYDKQLNFSDLAIIILASLLVAIIAIFVLRARGKVKTR